jgi:hypothetical protein
MRITAACPEAMMYEANNLAMCLGQSAADGQTFVNIAWQDDDGSLYSCASFEASEAWVESAQSPLVRPEWDVDEIIDMDAANAAQAAMIFWTPTEDEPVAPLATTDHLTAITGNDPQASLVAMGLKAKEETPPEPEPVDPFDDEAP